MIALNKMMLCMGLFRHMEMNLIKMADKDLLKQ